MPSRAPPRRRRSPSGWRPSAGRCGPRPGARRTRGCRASPRRRWAARSAATARRARCAAPGAEVTTREVRPPRHPAGRHPSAGRDGRPRPSWARTSADPAPRMHGDGGRHPLVDPRVSPETNCFCSTKNTISTGRATMIDPAATRLVSVKNWPRRLFSALVTGNLSPAGHQHGGPEELVVDPGHLQGRQRRQGRADQRHGELPVLPPHAGAVHLGRLVDLVRQRLHVVAQHERAEPHLEGRVDQDQRPEAVEHRAAVAHEGRQRDLRNIRNTGMSSACGGSRLAARKTPSRVRLNR